MGSIQWVRPYSDRNKFWKFVLQGRMKKCWAAQNFIANIEIEKRSKATNGFTLKKKIGVNSIFLVPLSVPRAPCFSNPGQQRNEVSQIITASECP